MSDLSYIIDTPLPLSQDFKSLREEGLAYIQEYSGNEWTNLNTSDPGVTILDQLCFALTELGYCNDFPVRDILTCPDGKLQVRDQFYLPEEILTTSPVTADDYRKYVIDGVNGVKNVIIFPQKDANNGFTGVYTVYLLPDPAIGAGELWKIRKAVFFYLNKRRNLGETFAVPKYLQPDRYMLQGRIDIANAADLNNILIQVNDGIRNYIFPEVTPVGYDQLTAEGTLTNEVFNGPLLQNGFIPTASLGEKKDQLGVTEVSNLIMSVSGVLSAGISAFRQGARVLPQINAAPDAIITIDMIASIGELNIYCKGVKLPVSPILQLSLTPRAKDVSIVFGSSVNARAELPKGTYRDINSYYSIQNTFPEIFAVGADATNSNATDYQIAQSRQLKGYLTLFDQVLANQFSQLANVDRLFSFKNSLTGTPTDEAAFYAVKSEFEKHHLEYPVPYLRFSPTYYYQSLYQVPHIKPLLKDNDTFKFSTERTTSKELEQKSWVAYQEDPYNPYMSGLMRFMEDEATSLSRRNAILNHLLARHGESPLVIDAIINGSVYSNDTLKDQVIFKSLYLQNLGMLSYFRQKAYNCLGATKINNVNVSPRICETIAAKDDPIDFIFNSTKVDQMERLTEQDLINYSAAELKLSLLFGLKSVYKNYIVNSLSENNTSQTILLDEQIKLAIWLIRHRRGLIFIETGFLFNFADQVKHPVLTNRVELIFPDFMPQFIADDFKDRVKLFLQHTLPVQVEFHIHLVDAAQLKKLIPAFVNWHNRLIYRDKRKLSDKSLTWSARELVAQLIEINKKRK